METGHWTYLPCVAIAVAAQVLMARGAAATECNKILPIFDKIDIFDSSSAPRPARQIEKSALPADVCHRGHENSRYRIQLNKEEVWVSTTQFAGPPTAVKPLQIRPGGKPAGVQLGREELKGGAPVATTVRDPGNFGPTIRVVPTMAPPPATVLTGPSGATQRPAGMPPSPSAGTQTGTAPDPAGPGSERMPRSGPAQ